jgi:hypothetical protein
LPIVGRLLTINQSLKRHRKLRAVNKSPLIFCAVVSEQ